MYVYNETDFTPDQYITLKVSKGRMESAVQNQAIGHGDAAPDKVFLEYCATVHVAVFGGPRPNIKSGPGILFMFKNLTNKLNKYESRESKESAGAGDHRPIIRKATDRSGKRPPGRRRAKANT